MNNQQTHLAKTTCLLPSINGNQDHHMYREPSVLTLPWSTMTSSENTDG